MTQQASIDIGKIKVPLLTSIEQVLEVADKWNVHRYELAHACGVSRQTLSEWHRKGSELDTERLIRLNDALQQVIKQKKKALNNAF